MSIKYINEEKKHGEVFKAKIRTCGEGQRCGFIVAGDRSQMQDPQT